jgi:hypothetical protein
MVGVCVIQTSNVRTVFKIVLQAEVTKGGSRRKGSDGKRSTRR